MSIQLGYDGTEFHGSQAQPGLRTVQKELEGVLQRVAPGSSRTVFAGRTDRGVHAIGQMVSADVAWGSSDDRLRSAINAVAPTDITVVDVRTVSPAFHARYDAIGREYRYRIVVAASPPPLERRYVWWRTRDLNSALAQAACERMVGKLSFGTFAGLGKSQSLDADALTRDVRQCDWTQCGERHEFRVVANGFLPQMVRNMVAAIVRVAQSERPVEWIDELLAANDRRVLDEAAPPNGLTLWRVEYD